MVKCCVIQGASIRAFFSKNYNVITKCCRRIKIYKIIFRGGHCSPEVHPISELLWLQCDFLITQPGRYQTLIHTPEPCHLCGRPREVPAQVSGNEPIDGKTVLFLTLSILPFLSLSLLFFQIDENKQEI